MQIFSVYLSVCIMPLPRKGGHIGRGESVRMVNTPSIFRLASESASASGPGSERSDLRPSWTSTATAWTSGGGCVERQHRCPPPPSPSPPPNAASRSPPSDEGDDVTETDDEGLGRVPSRFFSSPPSEGAAAASVGFAAFATAGAAFSTARSATDCGGGGRRGRRRRHRRLGDRLRGDGRPELGDRLLRFREGASKPHRQHQGRECKFPLAGRGGRFSSSRRRRSSPPLRRRRKHPPHLPNKRIFRARELAETGT